MKEVTRYIIKEFLENELITKYEYFDFKEYDEKYWKLVKTKNRDIGFRYTRSIITVYPFPKN
mgnify:FL=1|tara:strand:+ start:1629 stop:1814 length:186 start_codon:yes stop_codon:yes gene_type:complete